MNMFMQRLAKAQLVFHYLPNESKFTLISLMQKLADTL